MRIVDRFRDLAWSRQDRCIQTEQLRDKLRSFAKQIRDEVIIADGQVSSERLEALGRLTRLVELCEATESRKARKKWPMAIMLFATLSIVSVLLFARVSEMEIELDAELSAIGFILTKQQRLTDVLRLSEIGVSGLEGIDFSLVAPRNGQLFQSISGDRSTVRISVASEGQQRGTITLAALVPPAETRIWLGHAQLTNRYRLSLSGDGTTLRASVDGVVRITVPGRVNGTFDLATPKLIALEAGREEIDLDLTLDPATGTFSRQLSVHDLSVEEVEEYPSEKSTVVRRLSTVLSGSVRLLSLRGEGLPIRSGEVIEFSHSAGELQTLTATDGHIVATFHGRVRGMSAGVGENRRSLMPSYLEWLQARHGLSLLWGATVYLVGLLLGALRWWGMRL